MRNDKQLPQVAGQLFIKAFDPQSCLNNRCVQTKDYVNSGCIWKKKL